MAPHLAFSIQAEAEKYGVYLGIAAFFGFTLLILLYFAQARELKRLREWAGRNPERDQDLDEVRRELASFRRGPIGAGLGGAVGSAPGLVNGVRHPQGATAHAQVGGAMAGRAMGGPVVGNPAAGGSAATRSVVGNPVAGNPAAAGSIIGRPSTPGPATGGSAGGGPGPVAGGGRNGQHDAETPGGPVAVHNLPTDLHSLEAIGSASATNTGNSTVAAGHSQVDKTAAAERPGVTIDAGAGGQAGVGERADGSGGPIGVVGQAGANGQPEMAGVAVKGPEAIIHNAKAVAARVGTQGTTNQLGATAADSPNNSHLSTDQFATHKSGDDLVSNNGDQISSKQDPQDAASLATDAWRGTPKTPSAGKGLQDPKRVAALRTTQPSVSPKSSPRGSGQTRRINEAGKRGGRAGGPGGSGLAKTRPGARPARQAGRPKDQQANSSASAGRRRRLPLALGIAGALVAVIAVVATSGGSDEKKASAKLTKSKAKTQQSSKPVLPPRSQTKVAVLNGTTVSGLANTVSNRAIAAGFGRGGTGNNGDQHRDASLVLYKPDSRERAMEVAGLLKISEVIPIDSATATLAGQNADVVVVVGADQTQQSR